MTVCLYILKRNIEVNIDLDVLPNKDDIIVFNEHRYIVVERAFFPTEKKIVLTVGGV